MSIQFNQCEVSISGIRLFAESATITEQNSLNADYLLGNLVPVDFTPTDGVKNSFQINYTVEPHNEPNYNIIQNLKNYVPIFEPISIVVGGITGLGYLENYRLQVTPNQIIKASVTYNCYNELSGQINPQTQQYNSPNLTGLAHYWSTQATLSDNSTTGSVISMDYNFKASWNPIYIIGNKSPPQVVLIAAEENFNITSEFLTHVLYTGQNAGTAFNNFNQFNINNIGFLWNTSPIYTLKFDLRGGTVANTTTEIKTDNLIIITNTVNKYY